MSSSTHLLPASRLSRQTFDSCSFSPPPPLPSGSVYTSCYCEENIYLLAQNFLAEAHTQASRGLAWPWELYVVFISNRRKTVALWSQRLRAPQVVVWDYHVVLVLRPAASVPDIQNPDILHGDRKLRTFVQVSAIPPHVGPRVAQVSATKDVEHGPEDPKPFHETFNFDRGHAGPLNSGWVYDFDTTLDVPCPWRDYLARTFPYASDGALRARIDDRFHSLFRVIPANVYVDNFASDRSHMIIRAPQPEAGLATSGNSTVGGAPDGSNAALGLDRGRHDKGDRGADGPDLRTVDGAEASPIVQYSSPPPPYAPLRGVKAREQGITHNLMESFVAMEPDATSSRAAEEEEDLPEKALRTSPRVGASDDDGNAATVQRVGHRSARGAVRYGQVMDVGAFMSWLSTADDASAPRQQVLHASFLSSLHSMIMNGHGGMTNGTTTPAPPSQGDAYTNGPSTSAGSHANGYAHQHIIYVNLDHEPEITDEGFHHALAYLYSAAALANVRPENARAVLAAACLLGRMDDLCNYAYEVCRQSISLESLPSWLEFVDTVPPSSDGSSTPIVEQHQPLRTAVFGPYAQRLRDDVFNFLVVTLPNLVNFGGQATPTTPLPEGLSSHADAGRETLLQVFARVPFDLFKAAVESPTFQLGSTHSRFKFAKDAIELRKQGIARGQGAEETVVLAFGGSSTQSTGVLVTRKLRRRQLWKVNNS
ncbi:hypothetical protein GSI_07213 [Ganoderma sinense ZZ0214-1]|uniref:Protein N-terminal glutamine amidohydrolase n=1 Tax=Ganoderma sinense ZZ0214-1 TaxID=1077348 RepID=A0A2G8S9S3_9APHY|nr:hypothetical protein GSI_07213 [Ganoderma sinense ZZ0214-1]